MEQPRTKRMQFSLLALLVFTMLVACGLYANYARERSLLQTIENDEALMKDVEAQQHEVYDDQHCPTRAALKLDIKAMHASYKPPDDSGKEYPTIILHGDADVDVVVIRDKFAIMGPRATINALAKRPDEIEKACAEIAAANKAQEALGEKYAHAWNEICQLSQETFYFLHAPDPNQLIAKK